MGVGWLLLATTEPPGDVLGDGDGSGLGIGVGVLSTFGGGACEMIFGGSKGFTS